MLNLSCSHGCFALQAASLLHITQNCQTIAPWHCSMEGERSGSIQSSSLSQPLPLSNQLGFTHSSSSLHGTTGEVFNSPTITYLFLMLMSVSSLRCYVYFDVPTTISLIMITSSNRCRKMVMAAKLGFSIIHILESSIFKIRKKVLEMLYRISFLFLRILCIIWWVRILQCNMVLKWVIKK